jgi:arsenite/tail-anchored protein-transporting ATPase
MTKYFFFSGKGGVGKTTMAAASAVHYARTGKKTLIVTTDPASNLADVFEQPIGHQVVPINKVANLYAMEIDPDEATREYQERIIGPFREIMPEDVMASLEEQFSSPCTTEMASFDRFVDFMEIDEFEIIIFDTAPTGHTIRLLELPVEWSKFIEDSAKGSGQTCLGPVQAIQESKAKYDHATALLRNPERTTFVLVMRPDEISLYETHRAAKELEDIGIKSDELIINGILPEEVCQIEFFRKQFEVQQRVVQEAEQSITGSKRYMVLRDNEVKGINGLVNVSEELFDSQKPLLQTQTVDLAPMEDAVIEKVDLDRLWLPVQETKALFFTGKGGVGKTTISCIAALYIAEKGFKTLLVTTDPAAHLGEVFDLRIGTKPTQITDNLHAVMIDAKEAFELYKEKTLAEARGKYSEDMLAAMAEELNSPCTEEMATFDKFAQFIESKDYDVLVFDTAPTGHTLRLLDLPFDYAKQVEMMIATDEGRAVQENTKQRFKSMIEMMKDKNRTVFNIVLYPEATPIMESYRAMLDLRKAGLEIQLVIANMVLPKEVCQNRFFIKRRQMQQKYLTEIRERFNIPIFRFPMMQEEVRSLKVLKSAIEKQFSPIEVKS